MKSFSNELKSIKATADKADVVGKKVIDGGHSSSKEVEKAMKNMKDLHDKTEKAEVEKNKKLEEVLKFLEDMEAKSVELSSKTDKLNSQLQIQNSHLSEPISANSPKECEELQHELEEIKKLHVDEHKKSLDQITNLEKNIKDNGGDPSQYSSISAGGLKKKFDDIDNKIKQKEEALKKEHDKQSKNEKLLEEYNKIANDYVQWSDGVLKSLTQEGTGSLEEQLKKLKSEGEVAIKKSSDTISKIEKLSVQIDEANVSERTDKTFNDLQNIHEIIGDSFQKRTANIEEAILSEKLSSVSKEQLQEFLDTFKHFDKSKIGRLDKNSFKAACAAAGEDIPDKDLDQTFKKYDKDNDGFIQFEEFIDFMSSVVKEGTCYEDILESFAEIAGGKDFITESQLKSNLEAEEAEFLIANMPKVSGGFDYKAYAKKTYGK